MEQTIELERVAKMKRKAVIAKIEFDGMEQPVKKEEFDELEQAIQMGEVMEKEPIDEMENVVKWEEIDEMKESNEKEDVKGRKTLLYFCDYICEQLRNNLIRLDVWKVSSPTNSDDSVTSSTFDLTNGDATPETRSPEQLHDKITDLPDAVVDLFRRQVNVACNRRGDWDLLQQRCDDLISISNTQLNAVPYRDVRPCWRLLYTDASILKACSVVIKKTWNCCPGSNSLGGENGEVVANHTLAKDCASRNSIIPLLLKRNQLTTQDRTELTWNLKRSRKLQKEEIDKAFANLDPHLHAREMNQARLAIEADFSERRIKFREQYGLTTRRRATSMQNEWAVKDKQYMSSEELNDVIKALDMAVIVAGAPGTNRRDWIENIMRLLQEIYEPEFKTDVSRPLKRRRINHESSGKHDDDLFSDVTTFVPPVLCRVRTREHVSAIAFKQLAARQWHTTIGPRPIVIQKGATSWPAMQQHPWKRPSYLLHKTLGGRRMVPIETGRSYVDEDFGQKILTFREFLNNYVLSTPSMTTKRVNNTDQAEHGTETGYLAQHDLFLQIPSLRSDIKIPDLCHIIELPAHPSSPLVEEHRACPRLKKPLMNAWFGPACTISPLHNDPYHNMLAQVVGRKYIRLYPPLESQKLYPRGMEENGINMKNTSALDIGVLEGWDGTEAQKREAHQKYPLYKQAKFEDVILEEGDILFIPIGWWHYVRSLSISFSVSFWWN